MQLYGTTPLQRVWGWKIAAYLFGAGMGAGAYVLGAAGMLFGDAAVAGAYAMTLGLGLVFLSVPFLIWDLEQPRKFWRVLMRARRSWLSRGAWILLAFSTLGVLTLGLVVWPGKLAQTAAGFWQVLLALGLAAGVLVAVYTGLLVGTMLARPFWNNSILPVVFLVSALSTGMAVVGLGGHLFATPNLAGAIATFMKMSRPLHVGLLLGELVLLYFYLSIAYNRARAAVRNVTVGRLAAPFWGLAIGAGLVLPLLLEGILPTMAGVPGELLAYAGVLVGGFTLRNVILLAGTRAEVDNLGMAVVIRPEA